MLVNKIHAKLPSSHVRPAICSRLNVSSAIAQKTIDNGRTTTSEWASPREVPPVRNKIVRKTANIQNWMDADFILAAAAGKAKHSIK